MNDRKAPYLKAAARRCATRSAIDPETNNSRFRCAHSFRGLQIPGNPGDGCKADRKSSAGMTSRTDRSVRGAEKILSTTAAPSIRVNHRGRTWRGQRHADSMRVRKGLSTRRLAVARRSPSSGASVETFVSRLKAERAELCRQRKPRKGNQDALLPDRD